MMTSHPLDVRQGADTELASTLVAGLLEVSFTWFRRAGAAASLPGTARALASLSGRPGLAERSQIAVAARRLAPAHDLTHVITTIGPAFAGWTRSRLRPAGFRLLTVPGVARPEHLNGIVWPEVVVALTETGAAELRAAGAADVRVIPPGIDLARWPRRPRLSHRGDVVRLLYAGHFGESTGADAAIEAAVALQQEGYAVRLVMAMRQRGRQLVHAEATKLMRRAAAAGVYQAAVHGRVQDMSALVAACDAVVMPPAILADGKAQVPLTILEAMATGRPVVVSRLPSLAVLGDGVRWCEPGNGIEAGKQLLELLDESTWAQQCEAGRQVVEQRFAAERMCEAYRGLYRELLSEG